MEQRIRIWSHAYRPGILYLTLCVCGIAHQPALAQSPVASTPPVILSNSISTEARSLTLELIALDEVGKPVTDLKPEELRLFKDKQELKIDTLASAANEPLTIGLFFDISGSRRADKSIGEETRLTSEFLRSMWHGGDTAFVVTFGDRPYAAAQPTQKLDDIDQGLRQVLDATYFGPTALYDALCIVKPEMLAKIPGRKIYVVFSDFEDNSSRNKAENVIEVARKATISIFPVILSQGFGGGYSKRIEKRSREQARVIADDTGGEVLIPESRKQLPATFERLTNDLKAAYSLTYAPAGSNSEDKKRKKIRLETARQRVKLIYPQS